MAKRSGEQVKQGKAFEYAVVRELEMRYGVYGAYIDYDPAAVTAKGYFDDYCAKDMDFVHDLTAGARAGINVIERLEPKLQDGRFCISMASDSEGIRGDVRDVIVSTSSWQIGISCKHGNEDAKHSRLSDKNDFGDSWLGLPVSDEYWAVVREVFGRIREMRVDTPNMLWDDVPNKFEDYYYPVLCAFRDELLRLNKRYGNVPELFARYLIGQKDFYKVISFDSKRYTRVEGFNMNGSLNKSGKSGRPLIRVPRMELPKVFYSVDIDPIAKNWLYVVCDGGWNFGIRIHTAESKIAPSLKLAVSIDARPIKSLHLEVMPW